MGLCRWHFMQWHMAKRTVWWSCWFWTSRAGIRGLQRLEEGKVCMHDAIFTAHILSTIVPKVGTVNIHGHRLTEARETAWKAVDFVCKQYTPANKWPVGTEQGARQHIRFISCRIIGVVYQTPVPVAATLLSYSRHSGTLGQWKCGFKHKCICPTKQN